MRVFVASAGLQLRMSLRDPDHLFHIALVPFYTIALLGAVRHAGRHDLEAYAVLAPVLIALWATSVSNAGEAICTDRSLGLLESLLVAAPDYLVTVLGRVTAATVLGLFAFAEALVVARVGFGVSLQLHHPVTMALTMLATGVGMSCTAMLLCGLFVRSSTGPRIFQRAFTFPFYVLGGVMVPVAMLPGWVEPVSRIVFLSWASDLLRASVAPASIDAVAIRLAVILLLGIVALTVGWLLCRRAVDAVRRDGTTSLA